MRMRAPHPNLSLSFCFFCFVFFFFFFFLFLLFSSATLCNIGCIVLYGVVYMIYLFVSHEEEAAWPYSFLDSMKAVEAGAFAAGSVIVAVMVYAVLLPVSKRYWKPAIMETLTDADLSWAL